MRNEVVKKGWLGGAVPLLRFSVLKDMGLTQRNRGAEMEEQEVA